MKERLYSCLGVLLLCISTSIVYGRTISSTAMPALAPGEIPEEYTYSVDSLALYRHCSSS